MNNTLKKGLIIGGSAFGALVLFTVGMGAGASATQSGAIAAPVPAVTVTPEPVETIVEVEKIVEVPGETVTVEVTPAACLTALDLADEGLLIAADNMGILADTFDYIIDFDFEGVDGQTAKLDANTAKINKITDPYLAAKAECRN